MIFDYIEIAKQALPKVVVMENVPALATRYGEVRDRALDALRFNADRSRAYYATTAVLAAHHFGVPQMRERLFILGVRSDVAKKLGFSTDASIAAVFPAPPFKSVSTRAALGSLSQSATDVEPWLRAGMRGRAGREIRLFPPDPPSITYPVHVGLDLTSRFTMRRCAWDSPCPTLTVAGQKLSGANGSLHPVEPRKFTVPELKRLFGLPDDYILTGTIDQAVERICRMVPPAFMQAIAEAIYQRVLRPYRELKQ